MRDKRLFRIMLILALISTTLFKSGTLAAQAVQTSYGSAGRVTEAERAPEKGDTSNWLTIQAGDYGVRVVSQDGNELVAVDNFGGIYFNGDVYLNQKLLKAEDPNQLGNGFLYLLLVISLSFGGRNAYKIKKLKGQYREGQSRL